MSPKGKHRGTEATVTRILDEALEIHVGKGPEAFTMKAVIAATGMSSGSLYHHFGSFDGLFNFMPVLFDRLASDFWPGSGSKAAGKVRSYLDSLIGFIVFQRLGIRVQSYILHTCQAYVDHIVESVAAAPANSDDFYFRIVLTLFVKTKTRC
jgi:hypothetical protein